MSAADDVTGAERASGGARRQVIIPERIDDADLPGGGRPPPGGDPFGRGAPPGAEPFSGGFFDGARVEEAAFHEALRRATPLARVCSALVRLNVFVFVVLVLSGVPLFAPRAADLLPWGANLGPLTTGGQWWRLLTSMFLHFGLLHLVFNMWILRQVGPLVERLVGPTGFLILYLFAGIAGGVASTLVHPNAVGAGASGAIFGIVGALLAIVAGGRGVLPQRMGLALRRSIGRFVVYNLLFGLLVPEIDLSAHLVGLVAGFLGALLLRHEDMLRRTELRQRRDLLLGVVSVLCVALLIALLR